MKKTLIIFFVTLMSFGIKSGNEVKYKATFTEAEKNAIQIHLIRVYNYLDNTNLPHGEVKAAQLQIDSAWGLLNSKLIIDSTKK